MYLKPREGRKIVMNIPGDFPLGPVRLEPNSDFLNRFPMLAFPRVITEVGKDRNPIPIFLVNSGMVPVRLAKNTPLGLLRSIEGWEVNSLDDMVPDESPKPFWSQTTSS